MSAFWKNLSRKVVKCEYPTGEGVLSSNPSQTIQQAKFTFSGKTFEKHSNTIKEHRYGHTKANTNQEKHKSKLRKLYSLLEINRYPSKILFQKKKLNPEIVKEIEIIKSKNKKLIEKKWFTKNIIKNMVLQNLKIISTFGDAIKNGIIRIYMANYEQNLLKVEYFYYSLNEAQNNQKLPSIYFHHNQIAHQQITG